MSPSKTKKNTRNYSYTCATCDTPFTGHREQADKSKRFCKDSCRKAKSREADKAAKRQSRIEVQKVQWSKSTAGQFAISQCRREGSVAILWETLRPPLSSLISLLSSTRSAMVTIERLGSLFTTAATFRPAEVQTVPQAPCTSLTCSSAWICTTRRPVTNLFQ